MLKPEPRIVLIGGSGFIGSALYDELSKTTAEIVVVGRDVSDYKFLKQYIKTGDIVYYLASENRSSRRDDFWKVNVSGVKNIIDICQKTKVKKLIYVSTVIVFDGQKVRHQKTENFYIDSKVAGLKLFKKHLQNNFYIVYPGVVLNRNYRYKKEVVGIVGCIKDRLGFFTQGGLLMMVGNPKRIIRYIFIDELIKILMNVKKQEYLAVTEEILVADYINRASKITSFWPFRVSYLIINVLNCFLKNKFVLE
jgi:nucleoside-diphosphate-sugar epimerase